jgi:hypothetical protein
VSTCACKLLAFTMPMDDVPPSVELLAPPVVVVAETHRLCPPSDRERSPPQNIDHPWPGGGKRGTGSTGADYSREAEARCS